MILRNASIPTKMVLLACSSAGLALLMACVGFAWHGVHMLRDAKGRQLRDQAQIIAFQAGPVIALRDRKRGEELLTSLQSDWTLEEARIYGDNREIIAAWGDNRSFTAPGQDYYGYHFNGFRQVEALHPVIVGSQRLGVVYLRANTKDLQEKLMQFARIAATLSIISMLAVILISMRLQRPVSDPILALTEAAESISANRDYSIRVTGNAAGELKRLQDTFNRMLDRIAQSERALQSAQNDLEERVIARTQELSQEVRRRRAIQADLQAAKEAAEAANRAKTEFLANMSHEIRTPLNGIMGFTELLLHSGDDTTFEERQDYLSAVHSSSSHLVELINGILDVSKIEAGHFAVERIECSPQQIIADVISVLSVRAREKALYLDFQPQSPLPETIQSDPARLRQLVLNLVSNAIKFTESGGIRIVASLTNDESQRLQLEVIDTGIGIPADKLDQIFKPFCQADTSVTRRFGGTGLGLAISRTIAKALGGELTVQSEVGVGSVFTATIDPGPLAAVRMVDAAPAMIATACPDVAVAEPVALPACRVLVVDDGATNRKLMRLILTRAGADVVCAENGLAAMQAALATPFDVILMDMQMPIMDGYSAVRELRSAGFTAPIVALTAHAMKDDEQRCRGAGCTGYLAKPVDAARVLREVSRCLAPGRFGTAEPLAPTSDPVAPEDTGELRSTLPVEDPEFREIVDEFIERLQTKLDAMRTAYQQDAFEQLEALAHWLKGAGGTAGFAAFTEPARALEAAAGVADKPQCRQSLARIADLAARLVATLTVS